MRNKDYKSFKLKIANKRMEKNLKNQIIKNKK